MVQQNLDQDCMVGPEEVRILLVGDSGVGKTSLLNALVNDEYEPNLPAKMADITIPAEITPENVPLYIVDYSEREESQDDLKDAVRSANVLCIVYNADDDNSLDRVASTWIPTLRKYQTEGSTVYKPLILVANKVDLVDEDKPLDKVSRVIQDFVDVEAFIEVSAKTQRNVVELFSTAQKAVLYPLSPLFDPQMRVLTRKCRNALLRIFELCDLDEDGLLNDHELNLFQEDCFGTPLQRDALDDLKSIIKQSTMDGIASDGITKTGFLFLHALSIDKGRHDFTWQVLKKFGYDSQINLKIDDDVTRQLDNTVDDFDLVNSLNLEDKKDEHVENREISEMNSDNLNHIDLSWIRGHSNLIKAGLGLTVATLLSIVALRLISQGSSRSAL